MRRLLPLTGLILLAVLAPAARASFHLQTVNEVMTAGAAGTSGVQFVELLDDGGSGESFPAADGPYGLSVYDAGGARLDRQSLSASGLAAHAANDTPYLVSTAAADTALGATGDETLTVTLPTAAGQACYTATGGTPYSCVTWGCITKAVHGAGFSDTSAGAVPAAGSSAQRQANDSIEVGSPTPGAKNVAGTKSAACPGGGGGGGDGPPALKAFHGAKLGAAHAPLHKGRASVKLSCPAAAKTRCTGHLSLRWGKHRKLGGGADFRIASGHGKSVKVKLSRALRDAYAAHPKLKVRATIRVKDGAGRHRTTHGTLTLGTRPTPPPSSYPY